MPSAVWAVQGKMHVCLTLLITKMCVRGGGGCTMYGRGMTQFFVLPTSSWLTVAKRLFGVINLEKLDGIRDELQHNCTCTITKKKRDCALTVYYPSQ